MKIIITFLALLFLSSCYQRREKKEQAITSNLSSDTSFFDEKFRLVMDTLYINARFDECGEWGGHTELSRIYCASKVFYIRYQRFSVNCHFNDSDMAVQKLEKDTIKLLSTENKSDIVNYIHQLIDEKFKERLMGNAGEMYSVHNINSSINISVYETSDVNHNNYEELINKLMR